MERETRRMMGLAIEFERLITRENEIKIAEYLNIDGIPFCHYATYQKIIDGEDVNDDLYLDLMKAKNMKFFYDATIHTNLRAKYYDMKRDLEFIDAKSLAEHIAEAKEMICDLKDTYPNKMEWYIIEQIEKYYINGEVLDDKTSRILSWFVNISTAKSRVILIHLIYFNTHRKKALTSSLKTTFESLPFFDEEEMLLQLVITRQMIYENDLNVALNFAKKLEATCLKTNNYACLCEVYQDLIAIQGSLHSKEKAEEYIKKLKQLLKDHPDIHEGAVKQSYLYLGMCCFEEHDFIAACEYFEEAIKMYPETYSVLLGYLSTISYLGKESKLTVEDLHIDQLSVTRKIFFQYFAYKIQKKSKNRLKAYIMEKIMPILNEDYLLEAYVFKQELFIMKAKEEFDVFCEKTKGLNYVILQKWEEVFKNW